MAGNSGQEVVPQASFNSPSTSVLPIFNRFGEVTTTVTTATTISAPSISNINISSPTISVDSATTASTDSNSSQPETEGELQVYQISSTESTTTSTEMVSKKKTYALVADCLCTNLEVSMFSFLSY